jgi:hypothetical protein
LLILLLFGLPLLITGGLIYRGNRQQILNRALLTAIQKNNLPAVIALLAKGADPNARDWPPYVEFLGHKLSGRNMGPLLPEGGSFQVSYKKPVREVLNPGFPVPMKEVL